MFVRFVLRFVPYKGRHHTFTPNFAYVLNEFTARRYASAVYAVVTCPSIRPSDYHKSEFYEIAKPRITQITPTLFLMPNISACSQGASNTGGVG